MSGKTTLILEILKRRNELIDKIISNVQYIYGVQQAKFLEFGKQNSDVKFTLKIDEAKLNSSSLFVFDDQIVDFETHKNKFITNFVTRLEHHIGCCCILVLHNAFSPKLRTVALSTNENVSRDERLFSCCL